ncbi:L-rhamnose-binding lectin CSL2 [Labeo rohita]|uniref:L-rhamnose-binding lectin CSL2 n=1 Tax=Labeo rohita TaxID=84645 RepID=A0ABQ8LIE2_LABRO|nr:L-rhamnose-binding lectin CSL2 [Labeo rohita]
MGFIKVLRASYGRTDRTTCAGGRPANQISNTHCFREASLHLMSARVLKLYQILVIVCSRIRCDGRKSCSVPATNSVFSDPCYGTYKYLDVSYDCIPANSGVISVHHANYGRRDLVTCPHKLATTPHCYSPQTSSLRSRCNGRKTCQLYASNSLYSDPCYRVYKYLEVMYSCT